MGFSGPRRRRRISGKRHTEEQIVYALRQVEEGNKVSEAVGDGRIAASVLQPAATVRRTELVTAVANPIRTGKINIAIEPADLLPIPGQMRYADVD